ncbi:non-contractile tail sheath protein [Enterococcus thailandicus]|uniref:non-contractile tail sheath protein n=1 Tax=Enterococcus thailandicus TaxID=417368 RepID=UPI00398466DA
MYKLQAKYLTINFNFEMTASVVTQNENSFSVQGHFRTTDDLAGLIWETEDTHSHESLKYPTNPNFKNVSLSYDYALSGYTEALDSDKASALTIQTVDGKIHYIRLWNYVTNRPEDEWEKQEGIVFPEGRTPGNGTGNLGTIQLDFDNLYEGWSPYTFDANGKWNKNPEWKKIDVTNIKTIMWAFTPIGYTGNGGGTTQYLDDSYPFAMSMTNWKVTGDTFLGNETVAASPGVIRMCDDYDDSYNLTPERIIDSYLQLGYTKIVNFYIGASHYYDKKIVDGTGILLEDKLFNQAFEAWYKDYVRRLADNQMAIIHSISMENVDAKEGWWQRTYDGTPGTSGWTPTPHFLSFTNAEVQAFYQRLAVGLADISNQFGLTPIVQLGEPWWWHQDELTPCFYDQATRNLYKAETGLDMHEFHTVNESIVGHESMLSWLQTKIGSFTLMLRDAVKANYSNAQFTVLFFPPSVMDKTRTPMMMGMVNFPKVEWAYPNLDFFMLEDYDYLIKNQMREHQDVLEFIQNNLGYPSEKIHYFSGFVLDEEHSFVWKNIHQALVDGFNESFAEVYIWAYAQVKRDNWKQPKVIYSSHRGGNYTQPFKVSFSCDSDQLIYTLNGLDPTMETGQIYSSPIEIDKTTDIRIAYVDGGFISESVIFSYTIPMAKELPDKITSTGSFSDWVNIKSLAIGSGEIFDLSAAEDAENLYLYARGSNMNTSSNFYLDTGMDTGANIWSWPDAKMNYMIQNDKVYKYAGTGSDFNWDEIGNAKMIKTNGFVEITVSLEILGLSKPQQIRLGYGRNFEDFAPMPSRNSAIVDTLVTTNSLVNKETIAKEELLKTYKALNINSAGFEWEKTVRTEPATNTILYVTPHMEWNISGENYGLSVKVSNNKADLTPYYHELDSSILEYSKYLRGDSKNFEDILNKFAPTVGDGAIAVGISTRDGLIGTKILLTFSKTVEDSGVEIESKFQLEIELYNRPFAGSPIPDPAYNQLVEDITSGEFKPTVIQILGIGMVGVATLALIFFGSEIITFVGTIIIGITAVIVTVVEALLVIGNSIMGIFAKIAG